MRVRSLAGRLTAWYLASSFGLILIATGYLYASMASSMEYEDDQSILKKLHTLGTLLKQPGQFEAVRAEVGQDWDAHRELYARILSPHGDVLFETPGMRVLLPAAAFPDLGTWRREEDGIVRLRSTEGDPFRAIVGATSYPARQENVLLQVAIDRTADEMLVARYRGRLIIVLVLALGGCALVSYKIAHLGLRPLRTVVAVTHRIGTSTLHERLPRGHLPLELDDLAATFNTMLGRIETAFSRVLEFSDDIAHELRTPINNILGVTEVTLARERPAQEYRQALESNLEEAARMSAIIRSLLFLARADEPSGRLDRETVDLANELSAVRDFYEAAALEAGLAVTVKVEPGIQVSANRTLLQHAIGNLVDNAIRHTPAGGQLSLVGQRERDGVSIVVADTGQGIPESHLPHVFERFYRVDATRSSESGNVGLGLAIVKAIVDRHGGSVAIRSTVEQGTSVSMWFP